MTSVSSHSCGEAAHVKQTPNSKTTPPTWRRRCVPEACADTEVSPPIRTRGFAPNARWARQRQKDRGMVVARPWSLEFLLHRARPWWRKAMLLIDEVSTPSPQTTGTVVPTLRREESRGQRSFSINYILQAFEF
jgi:hypothetical protein